MSTGRTVSETVRMLSSRDGVSQIQIADKLGISRVTVYTKLRDHNWTVKEVDDLAALFGVEVDTFWRGAEWTTRSESGRAS